MDTSRRVTGYDLFKLSVAIVLLILFIILLRQTTPQALAPSSTVPPAAESISSSSPATPTADSTSISPAPTDNPVGSLTATGEAVTTAAPASSPTATVPPTLPSATATPEPVPTDPLPSPTATDLDTPAPALETTSTPLAETPSILTACEAAASRSRLQPGTTATIVRRLNFRSSPGIRDNWLRTNIPGTPVEVISGPECLPYTTGAYIWWQVRLPDGETGWSAEGSAHGTFYFMEPE